MDLHAVLEIMDLGLSFTPAGKIYHATLSWDILKLSKIHTHTLYAD